MSVDQETVRHIARLARVAVPEDQLDLLARELSAILDWVEQLGEVETAHVAPLTSVVETEMKMREDLITVGGLQDEVIGNAPGPDDGYYVVPKVLE